MQEERQSLLLERITKSVHRLNEALLELDQSVVEINNHNQAITIVAELSEAVSHIQGRLLMLLSKVPASTDRFLFRILLSAHCCAC